MRSHIVSLLWKNSRFWQHIATAGFLVYGTIVPVCSYGQTYPSRPIRIIVPGPAGGTSDALARAIGQRFTMSWGQQVVVDNRAGASGIIGTDLTAKAPPDGYTIMVGHNGTHAINVSLRKNLPYDALRDFVAVSLIAEVPNILVVHPTFPAKSVKELISFAKTRPRQITYASSGVGFPQHLAAELFNAMAGIHLTHIPYKGSAPALTDVIAGHVQVMFPNISVALPHVETRRLQALGITSLARSPVAPAIPTVAEAGLPGYEFSTWFGIFAPAATLPEIVSKLSLEISKSVKIPEVRELIMRQGGTPVGNTSEEFAAYVKTEVTKAAHVIKISGATAD